MSSSIRKALMTSPSLASPPSLSWKSESVSEAGFLTDYISVTRCLSFIACKSEYSIADMGVRLPISIEKKLRSGTAQELVLKLLFIHSIMAWLA